MQAVWSIKDYWESFKGTNLRISEEVFGVRTVGA
jgi:hypothetical protein